MLSNPVAPKTKPSGNTGEIQFNNNGAFSSSASLFWDTVNNKLRLGAITFPNTDGLENQVLGTDGSGNLRWQNATADHGALSGLSDDDHPQYLNNARGDARYYLQSQVDTSLALKTNISDIVNNLTSTATNVPLSAAQGKALKDLIDTINSLLSSDELTLDTLQEIVDYIQINRTDLENLNIAAIAGLQTALDAKAVAHGSDGYIQFKSGSNLSSSSNLFWDGTNNKLIVGHSVYGSFSSYFEGKDELGNLEVKLTSGLTSNYGGTLWLGNSSGSTRLHHNLGFPFFTTTANNFAFSTSGNATQAGTTRMQFGGSYLNFTALGNTTFYTSGSTLGKLIYGSASIEAPNATTKNLVIKAAASQSANLTEWQSNTEEIKAHITNLGDFSNSQGVNSSEVFGRAATVTATNSVAIGHSARAHGAQSIAIGQNSFADGDNNFALGFASIASGLQSMAMGRSAIASSQRALAVGFSADATGSESIAFGNEAQATAAGAIVFGFLSDCHDFSSIVIGRRAKATASNQCVFGSSLLPMNNVFFGKGSEDVLPTSYTISGTNAEASSNANGGDLILKGGNKDGSGSDGKVTVNSWLGVGATPSVQFQISGSGIFNASNAARFDLKNTVYGTSWFTHALDNGSWQLARGTATRLWLSNNGAGSVDFYNDTSAVIARGSGTFHVGGSTGLAQFNVNNNGSSRVGIAVRADAAQSSNLQEWQNNSGTALTSINNLGYLSIGSSSTSNPLKVSGNLNSWAGWLINDSTAGSANGLLIDIAANTNTQSLFAAYSNNLGNKRFEILADGSVSINSAYTLPKVDGAANYVLSTDGLGNVSWVAQSGGGGGTPGGADTQIQYNSSGSFAGSDSFTWNNATRTLSLKKLASQSDALIKFLDDSDTEQASIEHTTNKLRLESYLSTHIDIWSRDTLNLKHGPARAINFLGSGGNIFMAVADGKGFTANDHEGIKFSGRVENLNPRSAFEFNNDAVIGANNHLAKFISSNNIDNVTIGSPDLQLGVLCIASGQKGQIIKAAASQTANLLELQDNLGAVNTFFDSNGGLVINETGQAINPFRVETSSNANTIFVSNVGGRVGINTASVSSSLNVGGDRILTFAGGAGTIFNLDSLRTSSSGASRLTLTCGEVYMGGGVGSSKLSIVPQSGSHIPLGLKQFTGGTTTMLQIQDSSGAQTMGLTTLGLTQAGSGNGIARFDMQHTVAPSSIDGDGVGLNFRTENASGTLADIAYIDAVYDDISEDDVSMRFYIRNSGAPSEALKIDKDKNLLSQGDIEVSNSANGAILKSPDGTRWRITVGNDGSLKATSL